MPAVNYTPVWRLVLLLGQMHVRTPKTDYLRDREIQYIQRLRLMPHLAPLAPSTSYTSDVQACPPVAPRLVNLILRNIRFGISDINHQPLRPPPRERGPGRHPRRPRMHKRDDRALEGVLGLRERHGPVGPVEGVGEVLGVVARLDGELACSRRSVSKLCCNMENAPRSKRLRTY